MRPQRRLLFHWALLAPPEPRGRPAPSYRHVSTVRYPARPQQSLILSNKAIDPQMLRTIVRVASRRMRVVTITGLRGGAFQYLQDAIIYGMALLHIGQFSPTKPVTDHMPTKGKRNEKI